MRFQPTRQSTRQVSCPVINSNQLTVPCVGSVKQGDSVMIITRNGEPVAVAPIGWGDAIEADISDAAQVAAEAQAVAEATGQHFFTDTDGVHVTEAEGDATTGHNILINALGILLRHAANYLTSITASAIAFYDGAGTAASNIVAQFGAALARVGYAAGNHVDVTDGGIDFSMPYDDGEGHAGTVRAEMYPEYDSAPAFVIKHGPTVLKLLSNLSMSLTGNILISDGVEAKTASVRNWLQVGTSGTGTIYGQSGVLTVSAASPSVHARTNESNPTNARDVSITATSTKRGLYDNGQNGGWIVYADDNNRAVIGGMRPYASGTSATAQNYYTFINADTGVGVQFVFNPSTLNLVARYTTNGGTNWSATRTLATWA